VEPPEADKDRPPYMVVSYSIFRFRNVRSFVSQAVPFLASASFILLHHHQLADRSRESRTAEPPGTVASVSPATARDGVC